MNRFNVTRARRAGMTDDQIKSFMAQNNLLPKFQAGEFTENVVKSGASLVKDTITGIPSLIKTGADVVTGKTSLRDIGQGIGQFYKDRYGGWDELARTAYFDPVGLVGDVSTVVGGVGAVGKAAGLGNVADDISRIGRAIDPIGATTRAVSSGANKMLGKIGTGLTSKADDVRVKGLGSTAKTDELAARAGTTKSNLIKKYDLYDRTPSSARAAAKQAYTTADALATGSGKTINVQSILGAIDDKIDELSQLPEAARTSNTMSAIEQLQKNKLAVLSLASDGQSITPEMLIKYRRQLSQGPKSMFGLGPKTSGKVGANRSTYDIVRSQINRLDPGVAQSNLDYGALKEMENAFRRYQSRTAGRQPLNFGRMVRSGVGAAAAGLPGMVGMYALDTITNDPRFIKGASQTMETAGKAMQTAKLPQAPAWLNKAYNAGRAGRMLTNQSGEQTSSTPTVGEWLRAANTPLPQSESSVSTYMDSLPYLKARSKYKGVTIGKNPFRKYH